MARGGICSPGTLQKAGTGVRSIYPFGVTMCHARGAAAGHPAVTLFTNAQYRVCCEGVCGFLHKLAGDGLTYHQIAVSVAVPLR